MQQILAICRSQVRILGRAKFTWLKLMEPIFLKTILGEEAVITVGLYVVDSTEIMKGPLTKELSSSEILNCW